MSFRGVIPPVITPFHADGSIDREGFVAVLEHLIGAGVHAIVIGGTTGEYYAQSRDERVALLELASATAKGRAPLIAGTGAIRTEDCIDYALVARDSRVRRHPDRRTLLCGADAGGIGRPCFGDRPCGRHADHALQLSGPHRHAYGPGIPGSGRRKQ